VAAPLQLLHAPVRAEIVSRILSLAEHGMSEHAIAALLDLPLPLVRMVIRGGTPDRSSQPACAISPRRRDE
jgi:hypothetical protein